MYLNFTMILHPWSWNCNFRRDLTQQLTHTYQMQSRLQTIQSIQENWDELSLRFNKKKLKQRKKRIVLYDNFRKIALIPLLNMVMIHISLKEKSCSVILLFNLSATSLPAIKFIITQIQLTRFLWLQLKSLSSLFHTQKNKCQQKKLIGRIYEMCNNSSSMTLISKMLSH